MPLSAIICLSHQQSPRRMTGLMAQESRDQLDKKEISLQVNEIE